MKKKLLIFLLTAIDLILIIKLAVAGTNITLLNPQGVIALQERNLITTGVFIMLLIIIPAIFFIFFFAFRYREGNKKEYSPDREHSLLFELSWWAIPAFVILIMAVITWNATHALDPYKPLESSAKPLKVQVVALRWKWLFIYPEENIASVNFLEFPIRTPVNFELTSDGPMNSFWIPSLSGQIYAMAGMGTKIHMQSDARGEFEGSAAEINGKGLSGMRFIAKAASKTDFDAWVSSVKSESKALDPQTYKQLAEPSEDNPPVFYSSVEQGLYNKIIMKYMVPSTSQNSKYKIQN